jgi:2-C-methyl-D-erythritol 4-phosphate cytidylyltransferase
MPAAGSGTRLGANEPKTLLDIAGQPLFIHAVRPFLRHPECVAVVVAAPNGYESRYRDRVDLLRESSRMRIVTGGRTRQESVSFALRAVSEAVDAVLIHDAARPFVTRELIDRVLEGLQHGAASVPGLPVIDTVKELAGDSRTVSRTIPRETLVTVQTPQGLRIEAARKAFQMAAEVHFEATDDVALIERFSLGTVRVVDGDPCNFKITTMDDLVRARLILDPAVEL